MKPTSTGARLPLIPALGAALPCLLVLVLAACAGGPPAPAPGPDGQPLGAGLPDPDAVIARCLAAMERRDFDALCANLAGPNEREGKPVPLIPGRNIERVSGERMDVWPQARFLEAMRPQPWVTTAYGQPRSVRNDPPTYEVPVRRQVRWQEVPMEVREGLLRVERRKAWKQGGAAAARAVNWETLVRRERAREAERARQPAPTLSFVWIEGGWRLLLGS